MVVKEVDKNQRGDNWLSLQLPENVGVTQRQDPDIAMLIEALEAREKPTSEAMTVKSPTVRHYLDILGY
jgi:hypothetical protein